MPALMIAKAGNSQLRSSEIYQPLVCVSYAKYFNFVLQIWQHLQRKVEIALELFSPFEVLSGVLTCLSLSSRRMTSLDFIYSFDFYGFLQSGLRIRWKE